MTEKDSRYAEFFMKTAILASELSFAKRSKVGAVLVKDGRILATGFNGTPHSCSNQCEDILPDGTLVTKPNVVHAEANIISFAAKHGISTLDTDLFVTLSPCYTCSLLIIQAGIKNVYFLEQYRNLDPVEFLRSHGVNVVQFNLQPQQ